MEANRLPRDAVGQALLFVLNDAGLDPPETSVFSDMSALSDILLNFAGQRRPMSALN